MSNCRVKKIVGGGGGTRNIKNLLTLEVICHGVPSPQMWSDYIKWLERQQDAQILSYEFRTKKARGRDFRCSVTFENEKKVIFSGFKDPYYKLYMSGKMMREICYDCPYARKERTADITAGDFWNIEDISIKFGRSERVSVVMINTEKGEAEWNSIKEKLNYRETSWDIAVKGNSNLCSASQKPSNFNAYGAIVDKDSFFNKIYYQVGNRKKELFNMLPLMARRLMKRFM